MVYKNRVYLLICYIFMRNANSCLLHIINVNFFTYINNCILYDGCMLNKHGLSNKFNIIKIK